MEHTHSLAEWAAFLSIGFVPLGVLALALAFAEADLAYFDPRPALASVWQAVVNAKHDTCRALATGQRVSAAALRDAAISLAALLALLFPAHGGTR